MMLRSGIEFFGFTPRRSEQLPSLFLRFDTMLEKANEMAELGISYAFRTWMLLSVIRISPKKWSEHLKDMGHRFPNTAGEYHLLKSAIIRERALEEGITSLRSHGSDHQQHIPTYMTMEEDPVPLGIALA